MPIVNEVPIQNSPSLIEDLADEGQSASQRYRQMFVGDASLLALLRYELLTTLLGPLPGALGYFLRARGYRLLLRQMGQGSVVGRSVVIRSPGRIALGRHVMVDDGAVLDAKGAASSIEIGDQVLIGRHTILSCNNATLRLGDFISIGPFCFFASKSRIDIGSNVSIGVGAHLMAGSHATDDPDTPIIRQSRVSQGIVVEDNVWIGSGAQILDGVTIGQNSIVGAGAVVSKDVPAWTVALGNPARVVQKRKEAAIV